MVNTKLVHQQGINLVIIAKGSTFQRPKCIVNIFFKSDHDFGQFPSRQCRSYPQTIILNNTESKLPLVMCSSV